ncbi:MAG TPA: hypothetical protein VF145_10740 [Chitinophagaceae bacterium]
MKAALEKVLFQFTGKSTLESVSLIELQKITEAFPYFATGHLLLSKKLKSEGHKAFESQVQRTAVHFHNPFWLHYLLEEKEPEVQVPRPADEDTKPLLHDVIIEEMQQHEQPAPDQHFSPLEKEEAPVIIVAEQEEEQYAATTTEEVMQQAENEERQKEVIASVLEEQLAEFRKPVTGEALKIEAEPYHTVDYFASQGIRVDLTQPQDKLGNQLRKFTDWLKQMKTVQPGAEETATDPEVENMIQGIAKTSNETKEIVTETMAEVLVKQGKSDKAVQLYIKLSFLYPEKSAYFAAKIEHLKGV